MKIALQAAALALAAALPVPAQAENELQPFLGMWETESGSIFEARQLDESSVEFVYVYPSPVVRSGGAQAGMVFGQFEDMG